jgi:hypothetical protein
MPEPELTSPQYPATGRFLRLGPRTWLTALLGFALFYFYSGGGPNQASRFDLDRALLEHGSVMIDRYQENTIDKAFFKGHHYSDKAPGSSLAALPIVALARVALRYVGIDPITHSGLVAQIHAATRWVATLPALLMCLAIFDWSIRRGFSRKGAAFAAVALGLTSPLWAYATLFWGHVLSGFCLLAGARGVMTLTQQPPTKAAARTALLAGLATGWAVVTEFPSAVPAMLLTAVLLWRLRPWSGWTPQLVAYAAAATATALVLGAYNLAAFGSPFHLGYTHVQGFNGMQSGLFGVTWPRADALFGILLSQRRGLLFLAPLLLLGLVGHGISLVRSRQRRIAILSLFMIAYYVLLNGSYTYWDGGYSYGPRHLAGALPFLALGLAPLFDTLRRCLRWLALAAMVGAAFLTVVAVSTDAMTPDDVAKPMSQLFWPAFREARVGLNFRSDDVGGPATNFGLALGLDAKHSLFPLFAGLLLAGTGLLISLREPASPRPTENGDTPQAVS